MRGREEGRKGGREEGRKAGRQEGRQAGREGGGGNICDTKTGGESVQIEKKVSLRGFNFLTASWEDGLWDAGGQSKIGTKRNSTP